MGRRTLVVVALVLALIYVHCRHGDDPAETIQTTPTAAAGHGHANPFAQIALAAAASRVRRIDITIGDSRIEGEAVDDKQQPIGGATVTLDGAMTTTTEADGSFVFDHVGDGDYHIVAEKGAAYGEDDYTLKGDTDPEVITLRVGPTIAFHVVDHAGSPIFGAKLSASNHADALSDRDGVVKFRGMELGDGRFDAVAAGYASQHFDVELGDDPGKTFEHEVKLLPSAQIGGVVLDQNNAPVPNATVFVSTTGRGWNDNATTDAKGRWKLDGFGEGKITATASSDIHVAVHSEIFHVDGSRPTLDLVLHVVLGATVDGIVVDQAGAPVGDVRVVAGGGTATSDAKGHFHIAGLDAGTVKVEGIGDKQGSAIQTLELAAGGNASVKIVMVESSLAGFVKDAHGQGVADVHIYASGPRDAYERTDEFGHFDLGGVPPGDYTIVATRDSDKSEPLAPVLAHTGSRNIQIVIPDEASVTGRVVKDGTPVDYFGVLVTDKGEDSHDTPDPVRSPDGKFAQGGLHAGTWTVIVVGPSFQRQVVKDVVVTDGMQLDLGDIAVTGGRSVRGRVTANGALVANATVMVSDSTDVVDMVSLRGELVGMHGVHTDDAGRFEIGNLGDDIRGLTLQASNERGVAMPRPLTDADFDSDVELALVGTGSIAGTIAKAAPDELERVDLAAVVGDHHFVAYARDGDFSIPQVPAGDYQLTVTTEPIAPPIRVTVTADVETVVRIDPPTTLVEVDVDVVDGTCTGIIVMAPGAGDPLASSTSWITLQNCVDDHHAVIAQIAPGRYQLCNTNCVTVDIAGSPAVQTVTITETETPSPPPEPEPDPEPDPSPAPGSAAAVVDGVGTLAQ